MTVITIRNVPKDVAENLKKRAAERSPLEQRLREVIEQSPKMDITKEQIVELIHDGRRERDESIARAIRERE
jgi:plasmid stability protein